jgi:hypothetical protein
LKIFLALLFTLLYKVCSESNLQGKITSIQIILETTLFQDFLGLLRADPDVQLAAVHLLPKGNTGLIFGAGSVDPLQVCHEATL